MAMVTLVAERNAKEGYEFTYLGPTPNCKTCKIKNACMNLEEGRRYRVTKVRDRVHDCKLHETVKVVEVEPIPLGTTTDEKMALENTIITVDGKKCDNIGCENYFLCNPRFFSPGKYKILRVGERLKCPLKMDLKNIEVTAV